MVVVASGCSSGDPEIAQDVTEDIVDNAYVEAINCLTNQGYTAEIQRDENDWAVVFDGAPNGFLFDRTYERCTSDAEATGLAFSRSQIPEGEERLAMAAEFQSCLESAGVEGPVTYDSENPYQPATLADAQTKLGYELGDPTVVGDPRFSAALTCLADFELLFPHRFEDHEDSFWSYIPGL